VLGENNEAVAPKLEGRIGDSAGMQAVLTSRSECSVRDWKEQRREALRRLEEYTKEQSVDVKLGSSSLTRWIL